VTDGGVTYVFVADVPSEGLPAFRQYEDAVLPLLADYAGRLERRLRSADGHREVHILWFPNTSALDAFRADPRRRHVSPLMQASGAPTELFAVDDVAEHPTEPPSSASA
jgi:hypothetical protein